MDLSCNIIVIQSRRDKHVFFILKATYVSAITEYIDFVNRFYIFRTKGDSFTDIGYSTITFAIVYGSKIQLAYWHDKIINLYNC
jgi:hypothetical protein